jgi:serine/threonine protein kinase
VTGQAERWQRVERICQAALERNSADRAAFLRDACGEDDDLRREVERLLAEESAADAFLEQSVAGLAAGVMIPEPQALTGRRLNALEVGPLLGTGGMGDVYRGRDTILLRDVAIKVLASHVATSPEQLARFEREARILASLNHPNIAQVYGFESFDGTQLLVMELVEGPTLADRIAQGRVPLDEAVSIAKQIAEALDAAHERGIIHRDLKPGNIKLRGDGTVKVLDFGLAKATASEVEPSDVQPTSRTNSGNSDNAIVGTAEYLAPEQARGRPADKRADIWAFGCVLFEMLGGRLCFSGDSVSDLIDNILNRDPEWAALVNVPQSIRKLLDRCLQKDPRRRLRDIGDAHFELDAGRFEFGDVQVREAPAPPAFALTIVPPPSVTLPHVAEQAGVPLISPSGTHVICGPFMRRLESLEPGAFDVPDWGAPVWSPDSTSVICPFRHELRSVRVSDYHVEVLAPLSEPIRSGAFSARGAILLSTGRALWHLPADGGPLTVAHPAGIQGSILSVAFVDDTDHFLFCNSDEGRGGQVFLATLQHARHKNIAPDGSVMWFSKPLECTFLLANDTGARYTAAGGGGILFVRKDDLLFQRLNLRKRRLEGDTRVVQRGVASIPADALGAFSVSRTGVVAWRPGSRTSARLTTFNRQGNPVGVTGPPGVVLGLRLSPDESKVLTWSERPWTDIVEPNRPGYTRLGQDRWVLWSPDGTEFIGMSGVTRRIIRRASTGLGGIQFVEGGDAPIGRILEDVSPDGRTLLFTSREGVVFSSNAAMPGLAAADQQTKSDAECPRFSPDGRWIIYSERDGGIFVQPFPGGPGLRKQIADHGQYPVWRRDGYEIVFLEAKQIWSVTVINRAGEFHFASPVPLFFVGDCPGLLPRLNPLAIKRDGSTMFFPRLDYAASNLIHVSAGWMTDVETSHTNLRH